MPDAFTMFGAAVSGLAVLATLMVTCFSVEKRTASIAQRTRKFARKGEAHRG
jgi:hypothetical protein